MIIRRTGSLRNRLFGPLLLVGASAVFGQTATPPPQKSNPTVQTPSTARAPQSPTAQTASPAQIENGQALFVQHCAFCHGKEADGGETGPDLTRSRLVRADVRGNLIGEVIRNGRPEKGMPPFTLSVQDTSALSAFIHDQKRKADSQHGGRKGVDAADLQTGNVETGKKYFASNCASCHSPTGDLSGVASRYEGLKLEQRMLYPQDVKSKVSVTTSSGQTIMGKLAYQDEFTVGLIDDSGQYRSWSTSEVKYKIDAPVEAHAGLLAKYSDDDIHNLMAFLQTLR
jgi:cytochrome c oxidase cbb3-type subunit 3